MRPRGTSGRGTTLKSHYLIGGCSLILPCVHLGLAKITAYRPKLNLKKNLHPELCSPLWSDVLPFIQKTKAEAEDECLRERSDMRNFTYFRRHRDLFLRGCLLGSRGGSQPPKTVAAKMMHQ